MALALRQEVRRLEPRLRQLAVEEVQAVLLETGPLEVRDRDDGGPADVEVCAKGVSQSWSEDDQVRYDLQNTSS